MFKKRKLFICFLVFAMIITTVVGCSGSQDVSSEPDTDVSSEIDITDDAEEISEDISFKAGKYTGESDGHNGKVKVEVEFSENEILGINVIESDETEHLSNVAFETITNQVLDEQSLNVDSVSGATVTSAAFKNAIIESVENAEGNVDALKNKPAKEKSTDVVELESDVIVIGGGGAGLSAALAAEQNGLSVILIEKNAMFGGHTVLSGAYTLCTGAEIQKQLGVNDDTPGEAYDDIMEAGGGKSVPELLKMYTENMGEATDWTLDYVGAEAPDKLTVLAENGKDRALIYKGGGKGLMDALINKVSETTVDTYLNTKATTLLTDGDEVIGVEAEHQDGTTYNIKATSTILATGGYGARKDLLPESLDNFLYYGSSAANGDGLEMGQEVGADTVNMGEVKMYSNGIEWKPGIAKLTGPGNRAAEEKSAFLIDRNGKRVVNEKGSDKSLTDMQKAQPDGMLLMFMDQSSFDTFRENVKSMSDEMIDSWLEENGQSRPIFAHGETIEDVCEAAGVDAEELHKTIERYNGFVENGEDEDFGRPVEYLKEKVGDGPYYLMEQVPRYATTLGGLLINENLEVINTQGEPIKGLYSAGDTAGGVRGENSISGGDVGWALTSGYVIGRDLTK